MRRWKARCQKDRQRWLWQDRNQKKLEQERKWTGIKRNDGLMSKHQSSITDYRLTFVVENTITYGQRMNDSNDIHSKRKKDLWVITA